MGGRNIWENVNVRIRDRNDRTNTSEVTIRNGEWGNQWDFRIIPPQNDGRPQKNNRTSFLITLNLLKHQNLTCERGQF